MFGAFIRALALALALFPALAEAQYPGGFPAGVFDNVAARAPAVGISPSLDPNAASSASNHASAATTSVTISTTNSNDIIVVAMTANACNGGSLTISDTSSLTWNVRVGAGGGNMRMWWALASSPLSSDVITTNCTAGTFFSTVAFALTGANTSAPFDTNGALPSVQTTSTLASITTSEAFDILVSFYSCTGGGPYTAASGWTIIPNTSTSGSFLAAQYKVVSSTQSALTAPTATSCTNNRGIGDASAGAVQ